MRAASICAVLCLAAGCNCGGPPIPGPSGGGAASGGSGGAAGGGAATGGGDASGGGAAGGGAAALGGGTATGGGPPDAGPTSLAVISVDTLTLDFGDIPYFGAATPFYALRRLTLRNIGTQPENGDPTENLQLGVNGVAPLLTVVSANASSPVSALEVALPAQYNPTTGLVAGHHLDLPVRIEPPASGLTMEWTLKIFSNDTAHPELDVTIKARSVTVPPCNASIAPAQLDFGVVSQPDTADLTFTVTNLGVNPGDTCLIVGIDFVAGSDDVFSLRDGPVFGQTLQPAASLDVVVRVTPQSSGVMSASAVDVGISTPSLPVHVVPLQSTSN